MLDNNNIINPNLQPKAGVEHGPRALREAGIVDIIKTLGKNITLYQCTFISFYFSFVTCELVMI